MKSCMLVSTGTGEVAVFCAAAFAGGPDAEEGEGGKKHSGAHGLILQ